MTRRPRTSIAANPALIGAITVLVVVVATFLAYNANTGLPFVPTYQVDVLLPNADGLGRGADVRIGGGRVGRVMDVVPATRPGRVPVARLKVAIDKSAGPLPVDTTAEIRAVSALGARYLQLDPGSSPRTLPSGRTITIPSGGEAIDLDELFTTFDGATRRNLRDVTTTLGDGLAGRGAAVNEAIERAPELLGLVQRVSALLADPATGLHGFLSGAQSAAAAVAAEGDITGRLIEDAATTVDALASEHAALDELLREGPSNAAALQRDLTPVRATLRAARGLVRDARPAAALLPRTAMPTARLLRELTPVLRRTPAFARRLGSLTAPLLAAARDAPTTSALVALTSGLRSLEPTLRHVAPSQTVCNYLGLWARNVPDIIGQGDRSGTWFSYYLMFKPDEILQSPTTAPDLHVNPYPHTGQADAAGQCEAGNEQYGEQVRAIGNTAATEPGATEDTTPAPDGR